MPPEDYQLMQFLGEIAIFALNHAFYHKAVMFNGKFSSQSVKKVKGVICVY